MGSWKKCMYPKCFICHTKKKGPLIQPIKIVGKKIMNGRIGVKGDGGWPLPWPTDTSSKSGWVGYDSTSTWSQHNRRLKSRRMNVGGSSRFNDVLEHWLFCHRRSACVPLYGRAVEIKITLPDLDGQLDSEMKPRWKYSSTYSAETPASEDCHLVQFQRSSKLLDQSRLQTPARAQAPIREGCVNISGLMCITTSGLLIDQCDQCCVSVAWLAPRG